MTTFSGPDDNKLPDHIKNKPLQQRAMWVAAWNKTFASCVAVQMSGSDCEREAFAEANASIRARRRIQDRIDHYYAGQLCPYDSCCHDLHIPDVGWYKCGKCHRVFYADKSKRENEDYLCYPHATVDAPTGVEEARDLGPSWATPGGKEDSMDEADKSNLLRQAWHLLSKLFSDDSEKSRAVSLSTIAELIWISLEGPDGWPTGWLLDLYQEEGTNETFGIIAQDAKLFRVGVSVADDGTVELGEWVEVMEQFVPTGERGLTQVHRNSDGDLIVAAVVCTAVLNRQAEIDSTMLFDSFVDYVEETGELPIVNVYHMGDASRVGEALYVFRSDYLYVSVYRFDDNEFGRAAAESLANDPEYWGHSIEFYATAYEMMEVANGISIPVYTKGVNTAISILPEKRAAAHFTQSKITRGVNMKDETLDALNKLFGGDEELVNSFVEKLDGMNRQIEVEALITRAADLEEEEVEEEVETEDVEEETEDAEEAEEEIEDVEETEDEEVEEAEEQEEVEGEELVEGEVAEIELEINDEIIDEVAETVIQSGKLHDAIANSPAIVELLETVRQLNDRVNESGGTTIQKLNSIGSRLDKLEADDNDKLQERVAHLPRQPIVNLVRRPSEVRDNDNGNGPADFAAIAAETRNKLQKVK